MKSLTTKLILVLCFLTTLTQILAQQPPSKTTAMTSNNNNNNNNANLRGGGEQQRTIVGGYRPVDDLKDDRLLQAAQFAVKHLAQADKTYSFASALADDNGLQLKVVQAEQQVVAGLNYRLTILLLQQKNDSTTTTTTCVGAFSVVVYCRFDGTMSITTWNEEVSCQEALVLLEKQSGGGGH